MLLSCGAEKPRDLGIPGREADGIHFAMEFLPQQNRRISGEPLGHVDELSAKGKHVVVIGGGDTGSDCIGTSIRQGASSVTNFEIMPEPPLKENKDLSWPHWPLKLRTSSSHEEGAARDFAVMTKAIAVQGGRVTGLTCVKLDAKMKEIEGSDFEVKADLVLLAMGFLGPVTDGMVEGGRPRARRQRQRESRRPPLPDLTSQSLRRRRHAPRPIPRRLGHPRRPPGRARDRSGIDGEDGFAEVGRLRDAGRLSPQAKRSGERVG